MAPISRITSVWSGGPGLPGYTNFYMLNPTGMAAAIDTQWGAMMGLIPNQISIRTVAAGDVFESTTGELVGAWSEVGDYTHVGTSTGTHAAPVGAVVNLHTLDVNRGHKVRGRFFCVPLASEAFEDDGSLSASSLSNITGTWANLLTTASPNWVVWSRPRYPVNAAGVRVPGSVATGGKSCQVTSVTVPDLAAVLRSRRD